MCVSLALQIHHPIQPSPKNIFANCARARPPGPLVHVHDEISEISHLSQVSGGLPKKGGSVYAHDPPRRCT